MKNKEPGTRNKEQRTKIMKKKALYLKIAFVAVCIMLICNRIEAQETKDLPSASYKMTTAIPEGIEMPDKVSSRLGELKFFDGFPDEATAEKVYDNLDFQRAVQGYLMGIAPVSMFTMRSFVTKWGPVSSTVLTFESLFDSRTLCLTTNCNSPYTLAWYDCISSVILQ